MVEGVVRIAGNNITTPTIVLVALLLISGTQFMLVAMWFDMESNTRSALTRRRARSFDLHVRAK